MPTQLLLAPVGVGKTNRALAALTETLKRESFAKVWVLLPTRRQEDAFRQRLIDYDPTRRVYFNVEFFNFYSLYARLLDIAARPQRQLDHTARARILREILVDPPFREELEVYEEIADKSGFVEIVADFIYELKQNLIQPEIFGKVARTPKDRDLSKIYAAYQDKLRLYDLVDREGEGWLALEALRDIPEMGQEVSLFIVDGFDQFNPLQAQLLALLAQRSRDALVTLPFVPARENTVGRRFREAYTRLQTVFAEIKEPLYEEQLVEAPGFRHPALRYLSERTFLPASNGDKPLTEGSLFLLEAPDPLQETAAVLRRVKRLLLDANCRPDDILIAVRDWPRYAAHFVTLGRTYKIPLSLHYGELLSANPAIIALLNVLDLSVNDFRRRDVLDVLRSPYFAVRGLNDEAVDALERLAQKQLVVAGRADWLGALERERRAIALPDHEEEDQETFNLEADQVEYLSRYLTAFFNAVTPPVDATVAQYVAWLEQIIGTDVSDSDEAEDENPGKPPYNLKLFQKLRESSAQDAIISRDLTALQTFKRILRSLLAAQNLFVALGMADKTRQDWASFLVDLKAIVGASAVDRDTNRAGKVLVTSITDARGLPHRHILMPGLSEGVFPAPAPEDPLYLDSERLVLTRAGVYLETSAERAADEGLFFELISQALETLTLSRPTVQNGVLWPESHLWRTARDLFADAPAVIADNRIALGGVVRPDDVAAPVEALLSVAYGLSKADEKRSVIPLYNWLVSASGVDLRDQWRHVLLARHIESGRIENRDHNQYSGRLSDPGLINWVAGRLGSNREWSASQFNDYGTCGFRFFAKRMLKLDAIKEPEDGMDAMQRGTLIHAILEETYRVVGQRGLSIAPDNLEKALQILHHAADEVLQDAPTKIGFRESILWKQEKAALVRRLEKLVALDFSDDSPVVKHFGDVERHPYRLETSFSPAGDAPISVKLSNDLEPLLVKGFVDRIDRQGNRVIVLDYKSGSTGIPTSEMERGRNYQMMLYLRALEQILENDPDPNRPTEIAGGFFWHLNNLSSGVFDMNDEEDRAAMRQGAAHLARQIKAGRVGDFAAHPNKVEKGRCYKNCEFSQLCRISVSRRGR